MNKKVKKAIVIVSILILSALALHVAVGGVSAALSSHLGL